MIIGKTLDEALSYTNKTFIEELGGLPGPKIHCSVLAEQAVKNAIWNYAKKHGLQLSGLEGYDPTKEFGHDEADCPHDGRGELSAGGGDRLDGCGELLLVAGLLHHRDGDGPRRRHIGDRRAVDHPQEGAGDDGDLGRSSRRLPHERQGDVVDELAEAAVLEVGAEEDEEEKEVRFETIKLVLLYLLILY